MAERSPRFLRKARSAGLHLELLEGRSLLSGLLSLGSPPLTTALVTQAIAQAVAPLAQAVGSVTAPVAQAVEAVTAPVMQGLRPITAPVAQAVEAVAAPVT